MTEFAIYFICTTIGFYIPDILISISQGKVRYPLTVNIIWASVGVCSAYLISH